MEDNSVAVCRWYGPCGWVRGGPHEAGGRVWQSVCLKEIVNVGKSKVMRCAREGGGDRLDVRLDEEMLEEVEIFNYLGSHVALNGKVNVEVGHRVKEANKCIGGMKSVLTYRASGMHAKSRLYEGVGVPTALYGKCEGV